MTVSFVVLCASGSIIFGLLFGRLFAWWGEVKDEEQAMANAAIRARFDGNRYDALLGEMVDDEILVAHPSGFPERHPVRYVYDWSVE